MPATVVKCANDGKLAAGSIDLYLGGNGQVVDINTIERVKTHENDETPQTREHPVQKTLHEMEDPFEESEKTITEEQMKHEACRCLRCDVLKCKLS